CRTGGAPRPRHRRATRRARRALPRPSASAYALRRSVRGPDCGATLEIASVYSWPGGAALLRETQHAASLQRIQNAGDGGGEGVPFGALPQQLALAGRREPVLLYALVILARLPVTLDPARALQPVQRGIKRAGFNFEHRAR